MYLNSLTHPNDGHIILQRIHIVARMRVNVRRLRTETAISGRKYIQITGNDAHEKRIRCVLPVQDALARGENVIGVQHGADARAARRPDVHLVICRPDRTFWVMLLRAEP